MLSGVAKSGSPISRCTMRLPSASSFLARASTSKAPSVPSRDILSANRTAVLLTNPNRKLRGPALSPTPPGPNHPLRRDELQPLARHHHLPPAFVDEPMVMPAQRHHLAQVGLPAFRPELDAVGIGPADRPVAARPGAGAVPSLQAPPLRRLRRPLGPAHLDDHGVRLEHPMQGAAPGQPPHRLARNRRPFLELGGGRAQLAFHAFD